MSKGKRFGGYGPALFIWSLAISLAVICYFVKGEQAFIRAFWADMEIVETMAPRFLLGLALVGFLTVLAPREAVARTLGGNSGMKGLMLATGAGALLPGGPWVIMPLALTISRAGADAGACVAFVPFASAIAAAAVVAVQSPSNTCTVWIKQNFSRLSKS